MFLKFIPMASLVDKEITRGFSLRRWAFAAISTGVSVMPFASFARVFPVQGAIRRISRYPLGPMGSAASMVRMGSRPVRPLILRMYSSVLPKRERMVWT